MTPPEARPDPPDAHLAAAYYRNTIVHFFLLPAIAELALMAAADSPGGSRMSAFDAAAVTVRDLLKFDFFFRERDVFLSELHDEISRLAPEWREGLAGGTPGVLQLLQRLPTLSSDMMLRSFFEAYGVVADTLVECGDAAAPTESELVERCLGLARQQLLQSRLRNAESASRHPFHSGIALARHRGLLASGEQPGARREELAATLRGIMGRLSVIHRIGAQRVAAAVASGDRN